MDIENIWEKIKTFNGNLTSKEDFEKLLSIAGYKILSYKTVENRDGEITERVYLTYSPSCRVVEINLVASGLEIIKITTL